VWKHLVSAAVCGYLGYLRRGQPAALTGAQVRAFVLREGRKD
jgi:hypothetical protein